MLDLTKTVLPRTVTVRGKDYKIKTDFQYWINLELKLKNKEVKVVDDFDFLYESEKPEITDKQDGVDQLIMFLHPERLLPKPAPGQDRIDAIVFDYQIDSDLIYSAFFEQYKIDLMDSNLHLHWHKFLALFDGLHDTRLNEVMGYRCYDETRNDDYKKSMVANRTAWTIDKPLSAEEQKALEDFDMYFE